MKEDASCHVGGGYWWFKSRLFAGVGAYVHECRLRKLECEEEWEPVLRWPGALVSTGATYFARLMCVSEIIIKKEFK